MQTQSIDVEWTHGLNFDAHADEYTLQLSSPAENYVGGVGPKRLLLVALAGCTGMDVASLLPKMRAPFSSIKVSATGDLTEEHPKFYHTIHINFEVGIDEEFRPKVERAVDKSINQYCGVHAMLVKAAKITYDIKLV